MPNLLQILRGRKSSLPYLFVYCLVTYSSNTSCAFAGASHGTYYALYLSNDFLDVAIESRRTIETPTTTIQVDNKCKILPLSNKAVFIAEGIISNDDTGGPIFDGFPMATVAYQKARPAGSLERSASLWGSDLSPFLKTLYPLHQSLFNRRPNNEIVSGFFLGFDSDDNLGGFKAKIVYQRRVDSFDPIIEPIQKNHFAFLGPEEIVMEFLAGMTPRASTIKRHVYSESFQRSAAEKEMIHLKHLVETVPRWANDPFSGGDIAQIIFETKTKGWRWFHRPEFCPEH